MERKALTFTGSSTFINNKKSIIWNSFIKVKATGKDITISPPVTAVVTFAPALATVFILPVAFESK